MSVCLTRVMGLGLGYPSDEGYEARACVSVRPSDEGCGAIGLVYLSGLWGYDEGYGARARICLSF